MANTGTRLEAAMESRRVELRMSWRDVNVAAGMSYEGLRGIRRGERNPNAVTKARLEDALQWESGSIDAILAGGEPMPAKPPVEAEQSRELDELDAIEKMLESALAELNRLKRERQKPA